MIEQCPYCKRVFGSKERQKMRLLHVMQCEKAHSERELMEAITRNYDNRTGPQHVQRKARP